MVKTRSALLKEQMDEPRTAAEEGPLKTHSEIVDTKKPEPSKPNEGSVKTEPAPKASSSHKVSSLSSIAARKKAIELKAAEEKAKIELALIDARLAADIAALEDEARSSRGSVSSVGNYEQRVNNWLQQSAIRKKPEKEVKNVTNEKYIDTYPQLRDTNKLNGGSSHGGGGDNDHGPGTVAPRNITVKDTPQRNTEHPAVGYGELLSRLATSKDLPSYYGDPLEWMQFKQAYIESTTMCNYNDTENMWRLRKCLKGEAKEAVSSLLMGAVTPSVIIETLELQFGRPETVITKIAAQLKKMHPLPQAYHTQIVNFAIKIKNCATAARAMDAMYLNSPELVTTVLSKLPSALITKWADYLFDHRCENKPKMELLADFLFCEATKTATAGVSYINVQNNEVYKKPYISHPRALVVSEENSNCKFCRKHQHPLTECKLFKRAMRRDRWRFVKSQRLCYQCLSSKHDREACSAPLCDVCKLPHHKLLHWQKSTTAATGSQPLVSEPEEIVTNTTSTNNPIVLLKTIKVYVNGPNGTIPTHALLDDGATVTLISSELAERAGLHGEKHTMRLRGALNTGEVTCTSERVEFSLSTKSGEKHEITARRIDELHLPTQSNVNISEFDHLRDLQDCLYCGESEIKPQLLIGQDNFHLLVPLEVIMGKKNQPHATHTPLGWCIHGSVCALSCDVTPSAARATCPADESSDVLFLTTNSVSTREPESDLLLHEQVRRYFDFEAIGISLTPRENKLEQQALSTLNKTIKLSENQWEVGLPWKDENATMQESFNCAAKRLRNVEKKMSMSHEYAERYRDRVNHLFDNNYAREVNDDESPIREWYLPHFGVDNPKKKKLRLVFDAAAKSHGHSLNDYLLQGPDLYQSLLGIMFRFREKPIGIIGDIKDMFLRIKIRPEDQHALQFLWRDQNSSKPMKKYAMTSLIFGANCSPFIAQFVKNKNAQRFEKEMPEAVDAILTSHYMDDYIQSHNDEKSAIKIIREITYIHKQGGFEIRNWVSNNTTVLMTMPKATLCNDAVWLKLENHAERALGMLWFPSSDSFGFDLSLERIPKEILDLSKTPTKREVLKITMSIFDIYGLLAPFLITAKIILQEIWKNNTTWDDVIPSSLANSFREWILQLESIKDIRIPRWYFRSQSEGSKSFDSNKILQLHIFCDASLSAYAAVAYWRLTTKDETDISVAFIGSKCRIAPVKPTSVPRLELQAALIGCRLARTIEIEHKLKADEKYYWTDSTTVLHWIRNECRTYKTFIANRLGEIDNLSSIAEWHYVPTAMNIADAATKKNNYSLTNNCEWFRGPSFLHQTSQHWPMMEPETKTKIDENTLEKIHTVSDTKQRCMYLPVPQPDRFSSWMRLLRTMATVLLFIKKLKNVKSKNNEHHSLDCTLMKQAEIILLRHVQLESYANEIECLKERRSISKDSKLKTLTPYLDSDGLLRVGGRINAVKQVESDVRAPVILDGQHHVTRLIVKHYHCNAAHANNETVIGRLRQRYWVTRLRPTVRTVASKCLLCRIRKAQPVPPRLGDLPEARLMHHCRPFTCTGVDLFGPMDITVGRRHEKRYGVLFTCLTVRAIHIELVPSLTTDSLIMALRRMAARRGWPKYIYSDNGTNFKGADAEIKKCMQDIDQSKLSEFGVNNELQWHFISPYSPHMGGAWERLIRSVKTALKAILTERAPREEVLLTLLTEVENLVNSRPLTHVCVEPNTEEALTPNHFLLGTPSALPILGAFEDADLYLRKYWRTAQRLAEMFWQRWLKEVLPALLPRHRWTQEGFQFQEGDLVFIVDPNAPRNTWPRGRVVKTHPGQDGRVRVVEVKTKTGIQKRPATRLVPLPVNDECCKGSTRGEDVTDTNVEL